MGEFAVVLHPSKVADWQRAVGVRPDFVATFENWSNGRTLADTFARSVALGHRRHLVTWEPWDSDGDRRSQPKYSADAILRGEHDAYIKAFAKAVRDSGLERVYMRFAHEMNGDWYPWAGHDPAKYVEAWIRVRLLFRQQNAFNAAWVWAPNADLYRDRPAWLKTVLPYWPGVTKCDFVGLTTINFGGSKSYPWDRFAERFATVEHVFGKPIVSAEMNVAYDERRQWLGDLAGHAAHGSPALHFVCLSQGESYAQATLDTGDLAWSVADDPYSQGQLQIVVPALHATGGA